MLTLVPMSVSELESWLHGFWDDYLSERMISGEEAIAAKRNVQANRDHLFPEGKPAKGQYFLNILDGDKTVGTIWLKEPDHDSSGIWFIYDIVIEERLRGNGYGRRAMEKAENWARERNGTRLALNVFGYNSVARGLYDSLGYRTQTIQMFKDL